MTRPIPYGRQDVDEADVRAVVECLRGDWLTQGPRVAEFERGLCERTGARFAVAVSSGTAALHLAYLALGFGPGDVGVAPSITFVATANGFLYAGGRVRLVDVDPATGLIDLDALAAALVELAARGTPARLIAPVDLAGQPVDRARVRELASRHGARVVEDAAHALGATYRVGGETFRVGACAHADAAILSFHPVKHITTGEGGAVLTNDPAVHQRLLDLRSHGIHRDPERFERPADDPLAGPWYYEQASLGFNYRITDLQCALGSSQLRRLDAFLARRRAIAARYGAALGEEPLRRWFHPLEVRSGVEHAFHLYVLRVAAQPGEGVESVARRRRAVFERLRAAGILCQVHYLPVHTQPFHARSPAVEKGPLPGAEAYAASALSLPLFPAMTDAEVERVLAALRAWAGQAEGAPR